MSNASLQAFEPALYSTERGYDRSAIMKNALVAARENRAWRIKFAASPNELKKGAKPQSWRFIIAAMLRNAWMAARYERSLCDVRPLSSALAWTLRSLSTDGRLAA
jgi:hypothetical protein